MDPITPQDSAAQPQGVTPEAIAALTKQYQRLEKLFMITVAALILVVFSMNIYFSRAAKISGQQAANLEKEVNARAMLPIREFAIAMQRYAATDTNFAPLWESYRPVFTEYVGTSKSTSAPAFKPIAPKK